MVCNRMPASVITTKLYQLNPFKPPTHTLPTVIARNVLPIVGSPHAFLVDIYIMKGFGANLRQYPASNDLKMTSTS